MSQFFVYEHEKEREEVCERRNMEVNDQYRKSDGERKKKGGKPAIVPWVKRLNLEGLP